MLEKRGAAGVAALNGKIYVVGGFNGIKQFRSMEIFNPQTGTWKSGKKMNKRRAGVKVAVKEGKLYVVGGWSDGGGTLACGEVFDPKKNSWSALPEMLVPRSDFSLFVDARSSMTSVSVPVDNLNEETLKKFRDLC